jgi:hypothetical protein
MTPDDEDVDDVPFADPAIRTDYEAALGQFILAFNEVDYRVSQVIRSELSDRGRADLAPAASNGPFWQRLATLEILATSARSGRLSAAPIARLRSLNTDRNNLAHGHFDQNPFDGSYAIVLAAKTRDYPVTHICSLAAELAQIAELLRTTEILYDFEDLTQKGSEGTQ